MTGPVGRPLRAGASVNDVMGGMFAAIAILAAICRAHGDRPRPVCEERAVRELRVPGGPAYDRRLHDGKPVVPMPDRIRAWAVYDTFRTSDGDLVFVGVVTDTQWKIFCEAFGLADLLADPRIENQSAARRSAAARDSDRDRAVRENDQAGTARQVRKAGPAVRADHAAGRSFRRPASQGVGRARGHHADERRQDAGAHHADRDGRPPVRARGSICRKSASIRARCWRTSAMRRRKSSG